MKKIYFVEASVALSLVLTLVFSIIGFGLKCDEIRSDVVRLHILANSDSEEDQHVKLIVRDALLNCGEKLFSGVADIKNAEEILISDKDKLLKIIDEILKSNGFDYTSQIYITEEYFSTRTYENFTLPAGRYAALKIVLGEGEGHNWWCVMFPPLCLPAASEKTELDITFGEKGTEVITNNSKYEIRFKIIEIYEKIKDIIKY